MKNKTCKNCGGKIADTVKNGVTYTRADTCSNKCSVDYYNKQRKQRRTDARADTTCQQCGELFTPPRNDAKYCSPACKQKAYRARTA